MEKETLDKIWKQFIHNLTIQTFGERETIMGKKTKNLLGSVDFHKKLFMESADQILVGEKLQKED